MMHQDVSLITPLQLKEYLSKDLAYPIGIHAVYSMVKQKDFPSVKIGGRYFVLKSEINNWLRLQANKGKR